MRKILLLQVLFFLALNCFSQNLKTVTLYEQRAYYLNGGAKAAMGGKSRETIKIDLPPNTKSWYYSFTTTPGADGTKLLNLAIQVGAALSSSGLSTAIASHIQIPPGVNCVDVLVLPTECRDAFLRKEDNKWRLFEDISVHNAKQAVQPIENNYGKSFYLGLRNPSALNGVNIIIEVVAIVEETTTENDKGMLYGNLAWKAFEKGDLDKCLELSKKALTYNPNLTFVKFNIAYVHLIQEKDEAVDEYISAMADLKNDINPKRNMLGVLKDLRNCKLKTPNLKNLDDVIDLVIAESKKY
jgi:tetratricopeptide (TPR) repeat protein